MLEAPCHAALRSCRCCLNSCLYENTTTVNAHTTIPAPPSRSWCAGRYCVRKSPTCPSGTGEIQQMQGLGENTQADLESREIQAQEIPLSQKRYQVWKNTSHFCTLNRLHVQATHPGLCSAATALLSASMAQETGKAGKDLEIGKFLREKNPFLPGDLWAHHLLLVCKTRNHIACVAGRSQLSLVQAPGSGCTALRQHCSHSSCPTCRSSTVWVTFSVLMTVSVPKNPLGFCSPPSPAFHPLGYVKLLLVVQPSTSAYKVLQELKYSSWK